jgi:hypothetical protein
MRVNRSLLVWLIIGIIYALILGYILLADDSGTTPGRGIERLADVARVPIRHFADVNRLGLTSLQQEFAPGGIVALAGTADEFGRFIDQAELSGAAAQVPPRLGSAASVGGRGRAGRTRRVVRVLLPASGQAEQADQAQPAPAPAPAGCPASSGHRAGGTGGGSRRAAGRSGSGTGRDAGGRSKR